MLPLQYGTDLTIRADASSPCGKEDSAYQQADESGPYQDRYGG
jgi:hypothetical protein